MKILFFSNTPLLVSLLLAMAIAATEAPLWVIAFAVCMIFWKFLHEQLRVPKMAILLTPLFGIFIFLIVYIQNKTVFGQEESTTILLGLTSLAILNYEVERDVLLLVLLGFLLLVTKAIFSLDIVWVVPSLISFFGFWLTLLGDLKMNQFRYLLRTFLISLPLSALLFIFFPRFVLFQSSKTTPNFAQTGFSENLNPGDFSSLALQNDLVFRAEFNPNFKPKISSLYWRGAVLNSSNGLKWQSGRTAKINSTQLQNNKEGRTYHITQEPLNLKNLFVFENSIFLNSSTVSIVKLDSGIFSLTSLQSNPFQLSGELTLQNNQISQAEKQDLKIFLKHPSLPKKTQTWIDKTKQDFSDPLSRLRALEDFFGNSGFVYTLSPGNYKNDLDEFLFTRKRGFCEHFAAAFATMARALEIPARVVIGYQGGAFNSIGNFWKISQKDAHAWVEVIVDNHWQRTDPTALVTPLRIAMGGEAYFSLSEDEQVLYAKNSNWKGSSAPFAIWNQVANFLDNLNYHWTLLLLDYDLQAQLQFLKNVSFLCLAAIILSVAIIVLIFLFLQRQRKKPSLTIHPMSKVFRSIEFWAKEKQLSFEISMPPLQILISVANHFPKASKFLAEFSAEYTSVVYQSRLPTKTIKSWENRWSRLKIEMSSK